MDLITSKSSSHGNSLSRYPTPQFPQGYVTRAQCSPARVGWGTKEGGPELGEGAVIRAAKGLPSLPCRQMPPSGMQVNLPRGREEGASGLLHWKVSKGLPDEKKALGSCSVSREGDMLYLYYVHYLRFSRLAAIQSSLNKACRCPLLRRAGPNGNAQKPRENFCSSIVQYFRPRVVSTIFCCPPWVLHCPGHLRLTSLCFCK